MKRTTESELGLRGVEILHVDTAGSRALYKGISPQEKAQAQKLLKGLFQEVCQQYKGMLSQWAGDGGFGLFLSCKEIGNSARAAEAFLKHLPVVNAQTASALELGSPFLRSVRIKAHRGEVYLTRDPGLDSAAPKDFDDFLKNEKRFAPEEDEFFVTDEVHNVLPARQKRQFEFWCKVQAGSIRTSLYRMKRVPVECSEDIIGHGDRLKEIKQSDWNYLRTQIFAHRANVAARNIITKGLIDAVRRRKQQRKGSAIRASDLLQLTLNALYNYLRVSYPKCRIRVSYWRPVTKRGRPHLQMVDFRYPKDEATDPRHRVLPLSQTEYKACQAFNMVEPVATASVPAARRAGQWKDIYDGQACQKRGLASALQLPVYCVRDEGSKEAKGLLSLDSDKPDMFLPEEINLWRDDMVGFLANLALAEELRECGA
jgi:hypothetical protein